jgi:MFS family permease
VRAYLTVLRIPDLRKLWTGSLISLLGDGASWIAMAWLAVSAGGAGALAVLGACYSAPILVGGVLAGKVVDRMSRRWLLVFDSLVRAAVMLAIPVLAVVGLFELWHIYVAAAVFGLFKILPIGIVPAVLPELVPQRQLPTAIALEAVATGAAGLAGPALGGVLIPIIGAYWVLAIDAASYIVFAVLVLRMKARLGRPALRREEVDSLASRGSWVPVIRFVLHDRVMLIILIAFSTFNVALGMLIVSQPWLVHDRLAGGATLLGVIVGTFAAAELAGYLIAGAIRPAVRPMARIGQLQILSGAALLLFLGANPYLILIGQVMCGLPSALFTVSSQTVRYQRTPEHLRARTMTLMRTVMLGAIPIGSVLAGPLLASGHYTTLVLVMALLAGGPGLLVLSVRGDVVNEEPVEPRPRSDSSDGTDAEVRAGEPLPVPAPGAGG